MTAHLSDLAQSSKPMTTPMSRLRYVAARIGRCIVLSFACFSHAVAQYYPPPPPPPPPPPSTAIALALEFYHPGFDHYFVTAIQDEIFKLDTGYFFGWGRTGQFFQVYPGQASNAVGVCRFFSTAFGSKSSHFYTPDATECGIVQHNPSWQFEAQVFNVVTPTLAGVCPTGTQPIYRLYNNGQGGAPNHRYTASLAVREQMLTRGWIPEGYGEVGVIMCAPL